MCEAHAYLRLDDEDELFFENVDRVEPQDDCLVLENIFGQRKIIKARIKELALVDHKIILEKVEQEKKLIINNGIETVEVSKSCRKRVQPTVFLYTFNLPQNYPGLNKLRGRETSPFPPNIKA